LWDSEALLYPSGVGAEGFLADIPEVGLLQERVDHFFALTG
jgi:hypothetical protein